MIKTQEDFFINIFTSHFIARVRKGLLKVCLWEGDLTETVIFWPPLLWPSMLCLLVLLMLNRSPGVHSAGFWLSLLHLISIFSGPQFIRAQAPSAWCGFTYHISSIFTPTLLQLPTWTPSWLCYIIIQRPLDLWNRMFNRHHAEITVMQFRGHSLPVRQSMRVS